jgi:HSP20 family protein
MTILRFDPFRDLDRLTHQLASGVRTPALMPMDAWKSGDAYHVALDLPDVDPASIDLTVERNSLTVQAQRQPAFGEADQVLVAERPQGSFTRQLVLGEGLDIDQVRADYANGVLRLTIPVKQSSQPRRIEVQTEQSSGGQPRVIDMTGGQQSEDQSQTSGQAAASGTSSS